MKLLFVENGKTIPAELNDILKKEECKVTVLSASKARSKLPAGEFDSVIILDGNEPEATCQFIELLNKEQRSDGILVVSDNTWPGFIIRCIEQGADDYCESHHPAALILAKIKAVVRRRKYNTRSRLYFANLVIDFYLKQVCVWDQALNLTRKEYDILLYLIANKNSSVTKEAIAEYVWGDYLKNVDSYDFLFTHMKNLKNKLKIAKAELVIKNVYGIGYQIEEQ